jgi:hypothetical protein
MLNLRRPALAFLLLLSACSSLPRKVASGVVDNWNAPSAAAARRLIALYGVPDDVVVDRLTWNDKGAFKKITVWNRPLRYRSPRDFDLIEETVAYPTTREQAAELVSFSPALTVDVGRGEISARGSREAANFLTLNLADEVLRGLRTPAEARVAYLRILDLTAAGKTSPYAESLFFIGR